MTQKELDLNYKKLLPIIDASFNSNSFNDNSFNDNLFNEAPLYVSLGEDSEYYRLFAHVPQAEFQKRLEELILLKGAAWSVSGYLENRATMVKDFPQMQTEERFYHLGIDINLPCGTKLYAPKDCEVTLSKYEDGDGNYGGVTVLKFQTGSTYYMLFGHLDPESLLTVGTSIKKGESFAVIGDMNQNGNWYYHTHLQILTPRAYEEGWVSKGYCRKDELSTIGDFCPSPFSGCCLI